MSLNLKPSDSMAFLDQRRRRFEIAVDEDVALRRDDEVGGEVLAAHVVEISGDAERRETAWSSGGNLARERQCENAEQ